MRLLIVRYGAWGDSIIITPLLRHLKAEGHEIYLHTSEMGMKVLKGNPNIDKFIPYVSKSVPDDKLQGYWEKLQKEHDCDVLINMCESVERAIALHPIDPVYNYTKKERFERCNRNFYEYSFEHAMGQCGDKIDQVFKTDDDPDFVPELFFTKDQEEKAQEFFKQYADKFVIVWGLSGSSLNKAYPWTDYVIGDLVRDHEDIVIITVGSNMEQVLETIEHERVIRKAGVWSIMEAAIATKYADLVVSPDTGLLHAAGCFVTPKIGLLSSNTVESITKHFPSDLSIEADSAKVPCAPCFRIIYSASTQCPVDPVCYIPLCMSHGIDPKKVLETIEGVYESRNDARDKVSSLQQASSG